VQPKKLNEDGQKSRVTLLALLTALIGTTVWKNITGLQKGIVGSLVRRWNERERVHELNKLLGSVQYILDDQSPTILDNSTMTDEEPIQKLNKLGSVRSIVDDQSPRWNELDRIHELNKLGSVSP
jgi:hypothetical protein